jgi:hypothetical protein
VENNWQKRRTGKNGTCLGNFFSSTDVYGCFKQLFIVAHLPFGKYLRRESK